MRSARGRFTVLNHEYESKAGFGNRFRIKLRGIQPSALRDNSTNKLQCTLFLKLVGRITTYQFRCAYSDLQVICFRNWSFNNKK
jgi:hypothetical protein